MKPLMIGAALALLLQACAVTEPAMRVDDHLAANPPMNVEGRDGWQVRQVITFGEFRTGPVKRGWTRGYDYPFFIRFTGAREKLSFDTVDGSGRVAEVYCAGKLSEQDLHRVARAVDINLRTKDLFSGTVVIGEEEPYDFFVEDLNQNRTSGEVYGRVRGPGVDLGFRPVWHLATGQKTWDTRPLGIEFVDGDEVVAAVETVNDGRVWLNGALEPRHRLVIAGVASALLLRSDLADHND